MYIYIARTTSSLQKIYLLLVNECCYLAQQVYTCVLFSFIWNSQLLFLFFNKRGNFYIGTDIYQEYLVKALAKYFGARLLTVDSSMLFGVRSWAIMFILLCSTYDNHNYDVSKSMA
jgi:hypothetical protein